ncbi:MAG: selenocysteine-specific translation elongation factor [Deltaproteobacteria bacterium]|nr:selenocysteine-specific translation elongation factor [Deltaproteobacteria bacterium]
MTEIRRRVIGTAGHVDHGKTSLVKALTGSDCDRLEEEKRRGITIVLGFATWQLGPDLRVSIVDVPGHERFVHTMVSGASGLDAVLLVVAADDGVMPQTVEHLQICQLLGVRRGAVAISKADLVDAETVDLVREDVAETVAGTFLEAAPVVVCSALTGRGLEELSSAVRELLGGDSAAHDRGPAFLPIDRAFSKMGFGTVVTGTLLTGRMETGAAVDVLPGPHGDPLAGLRVRGLQIQDQAVDATGAGVRLAINLRGEGCEAVAPGQAVVSAGALCATSALHAELTLLPGAFPLEVHDQLALHVGTTMHLARVLPLGQPRIEPGATALARLVLDRPIAAFAGQRVVLRQPGRHGLGTVGGGRVLDPHPATGKGSFARWHRVASALISSDLVARARALLIDARDQGASEVELRRRLPPDEDVARALAALVQQRAAIRVEAEGGARYVEAERLQAIAQRIVDIVKRFHVERPALGGVSPAEVRSQLPPAAAWLVEAGVASLVAAGKLERGEGVVRVAGRRAESTAAGADIERVARRYAAAGLTPPLDEELRTESRLQPALFRDVMSELRRRKQLVRLADGLHCDSAALGRLRQRVEEHLRAHAQLTPADLKQLGGGLSRKFAIPMLEWLDSEGVTVRRGDVRVARKVGR